MAIPKYGAGKLSKVKPEQVKKVVEKTPEPIPEPVAKPVIRQEKPAAQSILTPQQTHATVRQAPIAPVVKQVISREKSDGEPA